MTRIIPLRLITAREWLLELGDALAPITGQSLVVVLVTGSAILLYQWYATSDWPSRRAAEEQLPPAVVKQKTERWSEEAANNPAFPPNHRPNKDTSSTTNGNPSSARRSSGGGTERRGRDSGSDCSSVETMETVFDWQTHTGVSFDDLGGLTDVKQRLRTEVITPLENPERAEDLGVSPPGVILYGPPGVGKTYSIKALATELGLPFVQVSGADIQSKWINESAAKVDTLFSEAQKMAAQEGGAVVFIDEIDSVLKSRSGSENAHEEDIKVVSEFLNHLEDAAESNIVFVGATNRAEALDGAGIRAGRVDLKLYIGKPDAAARESILAAQLSDRTHKLSDDHIAKLAAATDGKVAADLELLVNRAAKAALSRRGEVIRYSDFD